MSSWSMHVKSWAKKNYKMYTTIRTGSNTIQSFVREFHDSWSPLPRKFSIRENIWMLYESVIKNQMTKIHWENRTPMSSILWGQIVSGKFWSFWVFQKNFKKSIFRLFEAPIEKCYQHAAKVLVDLLMNEHNLVARLKSVKRFFLLDQGDFLNQFIDLADDELKMPLSDITRNGFSITLWNLSRFSGYQ